VQTNTGLKACFDYLYDLPESGKKVSVMGFCFGGSYSFNLAIEEPRLAVALPFYGHCDADTSDLEKISCPVFAFYGENDERLISGLDELKQRMSAAKVDFTSKVYPKCGHAFFNDTNRFAYNQPAAKDAWDLVLKHLNTITD
jgi:carboxymethylenebutenolidase